MGNIVLLEPDKSMQAVLVEALDQFGAVIVQPSAASAVAWVHENTCSLVVLELSLSGHSGFEFLYEFRTYTDWKHIPIIVYSSVFLDQTVLRSRAWQKLGIAAYFYKPQTRLNTLCHGVRSALLHEAY